MMKPQKEPTISNELCQGLAIRLADAALSQNVVGHQRLIAV